MRWISEGSTVSTTYPWAVRKGARGVTPAPTSTTRLPTSRCSKIRPVVTGYSSDPRGVIWKETKCTLPFEAKRQERGQVRVPIDDPCEGGLIVSHVDGAQAVVEEPRTS